MREGSRYVLPQIGEKERRTSAKKKNTILDEVRTLKKPKKGNRGLKKAIAKTTNPYLKRISPAWSDAGFSTPRPYNQGEEGLHGGEVLTGKVQDDYKREGQILNGGGYRRKKKSVPITKGGGGPIVSLVANPPDKRIGENHTRMLKNSPPKGGREVGAGKKPSLGG